MVIEIDPGFKLLNSWFSKTGKQLYLVGGAVRNKLLGFAADDLDVCAPVPASAVEKLSGDGFLVGEKAYGLGTLTICNSNLKNACYEYTAFRKDNYGRSKKHRPEFVTFTNDIKEDALRRDFSVNALYADANGTITDPTGLGIDDLKNKLIRACTNTTMDEDALRIMRMVRFSCELDFNIEPATFCAAKENIKNLVYISPERIYAEFKKILLSDVRYGKSGAILKGLFLLHKLGAFKYILPELLEGDGFKQSAKYHKYDVLNHSFYTCDSAPPQITLRLAALLHDISKPESYQKFGNMHAHAQLGAIKAKTALKRIGAPLTLITEVSALIDAHMFDLNNKAKKNTVKQMAAKLGKDRFLKLAELREADYTGSGMGAVAKSPVKWRKILDEMLSENAPIDIKSLNFNGNDVKKVLGVNEGPIIGQILNALHLYALKKPSQNNYQKLARYAKIVYSGLLDKNAAENRAEDPSGV